MKDDQGSDWVSEALAGLPAIITTTEAIAVLRTTRRHLYRLIATGVSKTALLRVAAGAGVLPGSLALLREAWRRRIAA